MSVIHEEDNGYTQEMKRYGAWKSPDPQSVYKEDDMYAVMYEGEKKNGRKMYVYWQEDTDDTCVLIKDDRGNAKVFEDYVYAVNPSSARRAAKDVLSSFEEEQGQKSFDAVEDAYFLFKSAFGDTGKRFGKGRTVRLENEDNKYVEFDAYMGNYIKLNASIKEDGEGISTVNLECLLPFEKEGSSFFREEIKVKRSYKAAEEDIDEFINKRYDNCGEVFIENIVADLYDRWRDKIVYSALECGGSIVLKPLYSGDGLGIDANVDRRGVVKDLQSVCRLGRICFQDGGGKIVTGEKYRYMDKEGNFIYTLEIGDNRREELGVYKFKRDFSGADVGNFYRQYEKHKKEELSEKRLENVNAEDKGKKRSR